MSLNLSDEYEEDRAEIIAEMEDDINQEVTVQAEFPELTESQKEDYALWVKRQHDESGVSGEGVVIEGATFATGHTVIHWLTPAPRGSIAFFDAFDDFLKIHIKPHPTNKTIITFEDGEQTIYDGG